MHLLFYFIFWYTKVHISLVSGGDWDLRLLLRQQRRSRQQPAGLSCPGASRATPEVHQRMAPNCPSAAPDASKTSREALKDTRGLRKKEAQVWKVGKAKIWRTIDSHQSLQKVFFFPTYLHLSFLSCYKLQLLKEAGVRLTWRARCLFRHSDQKRGEKTCSLLWVFHIIQMSWRNLLVAHVEAFMPRNEMKCENCGCCLICFSSHRLRLRSHSSAVYKCTEYELWVFDHRSVFYLLTNLHKRFKLKSCTCDWMLINLWIFIVGVLRRDWTGFSVDKGQL